MPNTIKILSATDATIADNDFNTVLNEPSETITPLLVLGTDAVALKAKAFVQSMLDSDVDSEYVSVQFMYVPNRAFIFQSLQNRCVNLDQSVHQLDWTVYDTYTVFALSPTDKCIADVVPSAEINATPGSIAAAILCAWAIG